MMALDAHDKKNNSIVFVPQFHKFDLNQTIIQWKKERLNMGIHSH